MATETIEVDVTYDAESDYGDGGAGTIKVLSITVDSKSFNLRSGKPFSLKTLKKHIAAAVQTVLDEE